MESSRLSLPYLQPQQAQKHVTVNESLRRLDALVQLSVVSATVSAQPAAPADGDIYILPAGKTGADWGAMLDTALAYYVDGAWSEITPREGWLAYKQDTNELAAFDGSAWSAITAGGGGSTAPYAGALVSKTSSQSISNGTDTVVTFDSETRDTDGFHSTVTNTSRLTAPPGVTRVKLRANIDFSANATGNRWLRILKNGSSSYVGIPFVRVISTATGAPTKINAASSVLDVTPGDYFEVSVYQNSGGNLSIRALYETWFEIEVVE